MKKPLRRFAFVGMLSAFGLAACGGGQKLDTDTPEAQAYLYRSSLMEVMQHEMGLMGGMARGDVPADEMKFKTAASNLAVLSAMVPDAFMENLTVPQSRAMPEIWQNWNDFKMKAQQFADAAAATNMAAQSGGIEGAKGAVQQLGQACGGCHRNYRAPEDDDEG
ncbi:MAG TPA: cytochrome c [Gammaproteobacteria bacterium]|nr:cytochrome c [Gammaproteobacteria bacterium]